MSKYIEIVNEPWWLTVGAPKAYPIGYPYPNCPESDNGEWYVGMMKVKDGSYKGELFKSYSKPNKKSHGKYKHVIGPCKSLDEALEIVETLYDS